MRPARICTALLCASGWACGLDPAGKWRPEVGSGAWVLVDPTLTLTSEGSRLTGTIGTPLGTHVIRDGRVEQDCIWFAVDYGSPRGIVEYTGKLGHDFMYLTESTPGSRQVAWVRFAGEPVFYAEKRPPTGWSIGYIRDGVRLQAPLGITVARGGSSAVEIRVLEAGNQPVRLRAVVLPPMPGLTVIFTPETTGGAGSVVLMGVAARASVRAGAYVLAMGNEHGLPVRVVVR